MLKESSLSGRLMLVLVTLWEWEAGRGYEIKSMNRENLDETRWVHTNDLATKEFLTYLDGHLNNMVKELQYEGDNLIRGLT